MPRHIRLHPFLTVQELHERYRHAHDSVERSRWRFLWLLARGLTATTIAQVTGYFTYWIGKIAGRYNVAEPDGMSDQRHRAPDPHAMLSDEQQTALRAAFAAPHPAGDR
jgi:hypothetical protein